jgi:hypothetical protein
VPPSSAQYPLAGGKPCATHPFGVLDVSSPCHPILLPAMLQEGRGDCNIACCTLYYTHISGVSPSLCTRAWALAPIALLLTPPAVGETYFLASKFHFVVRPRICHTLSKPPFSVFINVIISIHVISSLSCVMLRI